ncbi:MAG TPA: hypothetical protein VN213_08575 [Solirubrobacteraceae bacterium]|nr:hypothetical protein [Solirubrobacteraceae bacterium]
MDVTNPQRGIHDGAASDDTDAYEQTGDIELDERELLFWTMYCLEQEQEQEQAAADDSS